MKTIKALNSINHQVNQVGYWCSALVISSSMSFLVSCGGDNEDPDPTVKDPTSLPDPDPFSGSQIYLAGGATWGEWDPSLALPMDNKGNDEWELITWSNGGETDGAGVKFLGQQGWAPFNYGLDTAKGSTRIVNYDKSLTLILKEKGYHRIRFNSKSFEYSTEKVEVPSDFELPADGILAIGNGFETDDLPDPDWTPTAGILMTQSSDNPNEYSLTFTFKDIPVDQPDNFGFKFLGQKDWSPINLGFALPGIGGLEWTASNFIDTNGNLVYWDLVQESSDTKAPDIKYLGLPGKYDVKVDYFLKKVSVIKI